MSSYLQTLRVTLEDLRQLSDEQRLYAVLDACDAPDIQLKVDELGSSLALCLYRGDIAPEVVAVSPYLVRVDQALLQWLIKNVWASPWGIFIVAKLEPGAIRKHLRKFLLVKNPNGEIMYFRYYDPRVLPTFLASCNQKESSSFFGDITAFGYIADAEAFLVGIQAG